MYKDSSYFPKGYSENYPRGIPILGEEYCYSSTLDMLFITETYWPDDIRKLHNESSNDEKHILIPGRDF